MRTEWKEYCLDDLCLKITDGSHQSPKSFVGGKPMFSVKDMNEFGFNYDRVKTISIDDFNKLSAQGCKPNINDILIAKDGSVLKHIFKVDQEIEGVLLSSIAILRPNLKLINPDFLVNYLINPDFKKNISDNYVSGSGVPRIVLKDFKKITINIPSMEIQNNIAKVIISLQKKIILNTKTNEALEQLAKYLFKSWFVDFDPVKEKMQIKQKTAIENGDSDIILTKIAEKLGLSKDILALFPDEFEESELGLIPKGWEVSELGSFLNVLQTGNRPKGGVSGIKEGVPSIGAENINGVGNYSYGKEKFISREFFDNLKRGVVKDFDFLLYKDGGKPGEFKPRVSMFGCGFPYSEFAINEHVFLMRSDYLGQAFLYFQIGHKRVLEELANKGGKAAIPGINQSDVKTTKIIVPQAPEILNTFNNFSLKIIESILNRSKQSFELRKLRNTLLPKLLSGEITFESSAKLNRVN